MPLHIAILGNSGSGKSTLAQQLAHTHSLASLDLDTIAFLPGQEAVPRDPAEAAALVRDFCTRHAAQGWVMEGCYATLIDHALAFSPVLVWLDPGTDVCVAHCQARPWEPHKYPSKEAQDRNLAMLIEWVRGHDTREGELGRAAHAALFAGYAGPRIHCMREADEALLREVANLG